MRTRSEERLARALDFSVGGRQFVGDPLTVEVQRGCSAMFSCDADAAARLLPSPLLHPLRWTRRRSMVLVLGGIYEVRCGSLPPFRAGELLVAAFVTYGAKPAPPLLPLAGSLQPEPNRWRAGACILTLAVSNRVRREQFRTVFGWPARLADIRYEQRSTFDQVTCEHDGHLQLGLRVKTGDTPKPSTGGHCLYGIRDNRLLLWSETESSLAASRIGRASAQLVAADPSMEEMVRGLQMSSRPLMTQVAYRVDSQPNPAPPILAEAHLDQPYAADGRFAGRLLVSGPHHPLHEVDQGLTRLPFDPAADIAPTARANASPG